MRARATFDRRAVRFTYETAGLGVLTSLASDRARVRVVHDGNVAHVVRASRVVPGDLDRLDAEGLRRRLERFAAFVEAVAADGGARIVWA